MQPTSLGEIIKLIRVPVVAKACERTPRAIYKWINSGCLPRICHPSVGGNSSTD